MIFTRDEQAQIHAQAEAEYPHECCGILLIRRGNPADRLLVRCRNAQDEMHAKDPEKYPRTARTAYYIDHKDLLHVGRREAQGYDVAVIYHSHIDVDAYFSPTDRQNALMTGEPPYPDAVYVVLSVLKGKVASSAAFAWDANTRDFVELPPAAE